MDPETLGRELAAVVMGRDPVAFAKMLGASYEHAAGIKGKRGRNDRIAAGLLAWLRSNARPGEFVPTSRLAGVLSELTGRTVGVESAGCLLRDLLKKGMLPSIEQHHSRVGNGIFLMPAEEK